MRFRKIRNASYQQRLRSGAIERPAYAYCVYHAAELASKLGYSRMSAVEFGVAGGRGLLQLESHAEEVSKIFQIDIEIYGFDTGEGLPEPMDYRDLPYHWKKGFYKMDVAGLQARLKKAKLVLGDIAETSTTFFETHNPAPIGAIAYDLDFYSSTAAALKMLDAGEKYHLPRIFCYFDDMSGTEIELYNDYTGQRLAINEFNRDHADIKLSPAYHLLSRRTVEPWYHLLRICHFFKHGRYNDFISAENQQLSGY
jgi:hypothetical protein